MKKNIYENKPWNTVDEYYELGRKHGMWGDQLEKYLKKFVIPEPRVRRIKK